MVTETVIEPDGMMKRERKESKAFACNSVTMKKTQKNV